MSLTGWRTLPSVKTFCLPVNTYRFNQVQPSWMGSLLRACAEIDWVVACGVYVLVPAKNWAKFFADFHNLEMPKSPYNYAHIIQWPWPWMLLTMQCQVVLAKLLSVAECKVNSLESKSFQWHNLWLDWGNHFVSTEFNRIMSQETDHYISPNLQTVAPCVRIIMMYSPTRCYLNTLGPRSTSEAWGTLWAPLVTGLWLSPVARASFPQPQVLHWRSWGNKWQVLLNFLINMCDPPGIIHEPKMLSFLQLNPILVMAVRNCQYWRI